MAYSAQRCHIFLRKICPPKRNSHTIPRCSARGDSHPVASTAPLREMSARVRLSTTPVFSGAGQRRRRQPQGWPPRQSIEPRSSYSYASSIENGKLPEEGPRLLPGGVHVQRRLNRRPDRRYPRSSSCRDSSATRHRPHTPAQRGCPGRHRSSPSGYRGWTRR